MDRTDLSKEQGQSHNEGLTLFQAKLNEFLIALGLTPAQLSEATIHADLSTIYKMRKGDPQRPAMSAEDLRSIRNTEFQPLRDRLEGNEEIVEELADTALATLIIRAIERRNPDLDVINEKWLETQVLSFVRKIRRQHPEIMAWLPVLRLHSSPNGSKYLGSKLILSTRKHRPLSDLDLTGLSPEQLCRLFEGEWAGSNYGGELDVPEVLAQQSFAVKFYLEGGGTPPFSFTAGLSVGGRSASEFLAFTCSQTYLQSDPDHYILMLNAPGEKPGLAGPTLWTRSLNVRSSKDIKRAIKELQMIRRLGGVDVLLNGEHLAAWAPTSLEQGIDVGMIFWNDWSTMELWLIEE